MCLIPLPHKIITQDGSFSIVHDTAIVLDAAQDDVDLETAKLLRQEIEKIIAITLPIKKGWRRAANHDENCISFEYYKLDIGKEAYRLTVTPGKITISARGNAGFLYGAATLIQLCRTSDGEIGCVDIIDEPSYPNRGYMLDVSRGRVPTMSSLKELVDKLALYKINQLQLYMENCLRLDGFEEVWSQTDPFIPEEILELDLYCHIRGVELVPCIATFGHLYDLLRSVSYGKYREVESEQGGIFSWFKRLRHHTINVADPESLTLIKGILDQYIPLFRSNKINICCDEPFDLGKGKSAGLVEEIKHGELYISYVNKLAEHLQNKGKEVMIWGDILQENHELIGTLNPDIVCLNWFYEYNAQEDFFKVFPDHGLKQYVCPSVSGYSRLVNAYDKSFANIRELAELGSKYRAEGLLNTDWGDCGNINMPALNIPCMIYGAAQSWNVEDVRDLISIDDIISLIEYGDTNKKLVGLLRELSHQDIITFNDLVYFRDYKVLGLTYEDNGILRHEEVEKNIMLASEAQLKGSIARCSEIIKSFRQNDSTSYPETRQEMREYYLAARGVALLQEIALTIKKYEYGQDVQLPNTPHETAGMLENWLMDYCRDWRVVSRESELFRIKEFVWQICSVLRKYDEKLK